MLVTLLDTRESLSLLNLPCYSHFSCLENFKCSFWKIMTFAVVILFFWRSNMRTSCNQIIIQRKGVHTTLFTIKKKKQTQETRSTKLTCNETVHCVLNHKNRWKKVKKIVYKRIIIHTLMFYIHQKIHPEHQNLYTERILWIRMCSVEKLHP